MFYISIQRSKSRDGASRRVGNLFPWGTTRYQIYEDGLPLLGMGFETEQEARQRLRGIVHELQHASMGWYRIESRLPSYLPVRNVLGVRKVYGDGSTVNVTYVIRRITLQAVNTR